MSPLSNTPPFLDKPSLSEFLSGFERRISGNPVLQPTAINQTYFLETAAEAYLICFFEENEEALAEHAVALLAYLNAASVPGSTVIPDRNGNRIGSIQARRVLLLDKPPGKLPSDIEVDHCAAAGALLGQLHARLGDYPLSREVSSAPPGLRELALGFVDQLSEPDASLVRDELQFQGLHRFHDLPHGVVHGQFSRESILFDESMVSGILGLERMHTWGPWLSDLAHAVVGYCFGQNGDLDKMRTEALLEAYHGHRPLKAIERGAWPVMLRAVAFRRWLKAMAAEGVS
ncbi:phosphotransferase, partial [Acidihalobacter prosperus]